MRAVRSTLLLAGLLVGCTFAGLTDYETPLCDPDAPVSEDVCNQLNVGNTSCQRYQCARTTRRCVLGTLDEDRDGDPPVRCGGTDCDDGDRTRSGKTAEVCDGLDNDCDGLVDNGVVAPVPTVTTSVPLRARNLSHPDPRLSSPNGRDAYATYVGDVRGCVHGVVLGDDVSDASAPCTVVDDGQRQDAGAADGGELGPTVRQAELLPVGVARDSTSGVAFIEERPGTACTKEQLAFSSRGTGRPVLADCGAVLPALVSFPLQSEALIAFYDAPLAERGDPLTACASARPAPLKLRWVDRPTSDTPDLVTSAATTLGLSAGLRPPALLALEGGTSVLLGAPLANSVGLWTLTPDGRVIPLATAISALSDARSVAMAIGGGREGARLAVVAERGCPGSQSITMVIRGVDVLQGALVDGPGDGDADGAPFREVAIVTGPASVATAPSVSWVSGQNEWWVTWIDERQKAMLRRVAADGRKVEAPLELGSASAAAVRAAGTGTIADAGAGTGRGAPKAFLVRTDSSAIDEVVLACVK